MADTVTISTTTDNVTITPAGSNTVTLSSPVSNTVTVALGVGATNLTGQTTDALNEGSNNLYFTTARASAAAPVQSVSASTGMNILTSAQGAVTVTNTKLGTVTGLTMPSGYAVADTSGALVVSYNNLAAIRTGLGLGTAAVLNTGIANTNIPKFTSGVADDDFLRVNGTDIEGRSAAEVLSDIGAAAAAHTHADAYTGQIETAADKTYTIDPGAVSARTITGFYIKSASGTCTANLKVGTNVVKAASVSSSSGDQTSLANTAVAVNDVITLVVSSNSSAVDVIFSVEYTA